MAYVDIEHRPRGVVGRFSLWYSRRRFGRAADPLKAASLHPGVVMAWGVFELLAERRWHRLDPELQTLAVHSVSGQIGCPWCIDFGYFEGVERGIAPERLAAVAEWRGSDVFDARERAVLEFAEAATSSPSAVSAELVARVRAFLSEEQLVELAAWVAIENFRSRFNASLGLTSQGFSAACSVPSPAGHA